MKYYSQLGEIQAGFDTKSVKFGIFILLFAQEMDEIIMSFCHLRPGKWSNIIKS